MPASVVVIVPVRRFEDGKTRLADVMSPTQRVRLSRHCAAHVLDAASAFTRCVVSEDADVCAWAERRGVDVVRVGTTGLSASLTEALPSILSMHPAEFAAVVHADLPLADDLRTVIDEAVLDGRPMIVTDRHHDGTNVLIARVDHIVEAGFHYGTGSAERHAAAFARFGLDCRTIRHPALSIDIDTAADLEHPLVSRAISSIISPVPADDPGTRIP